MRVEINAKLPATRQGWLLKRSRNGCWLAVIAILLVAAPASAMQEKPSEESVQDQVIPPPKPSPWEADLAKYPGLLPELGKALGRVMKAVEFPAPRTQSRLLPMLPDNTVIFASSPNYGNAVHQALQAFQQELKENEVLRNWWQHTELNASKPGMEDALEKFYEFSQYLGDEIAVSADVGGKKEKVLVVAEVRKPGLKLFLQQLAQQFGGKAGPPWRLLDPQQLALAKESGASSQTLVLVRPNLLVISSDLATLRSFNATLGPGGGKLEASPFGQRLTQSYQGGAGLLAGVDLHKLISRNPPGGAKEQEELQRSGFGDVKYLIWEHKSVPGQPASQTELSFNGKRRGIASWLASPTKLGGLDFVAPDATFALSIALKDPALIFDDLAELAGPGALDAITQPAEAFKINFRNDVLSQLTGEITLELDGSFLPVPGEAMPEPLWKVMLGVRDAEGLQKTFDRLAEALGALAPDGQGPSLKRHEAGRLSYYTLQIPSPQKATEVNWAFSDGYMLVAATRARLTEAIRFHRDGESLPRSGSFHAALPAGRSADASALFYQNFGLLLAPFMQRISPEMAKLVPESSEMVPPSVSTVYADETTIRQVSNNGGLDVGVVLAVATVAIPNLLRSRLAANQSAAAATVRTLITSDIVYSTSYPLKGYAHDLAALGGSSADCSSPSEKHACLIDEALGCASVKWCTRDSYRYHLAAICAKAPCADFVAVATPADSDKGSKNFCATADGVVRYRLGAPLASPITLAECLKWEPL